MLDKIEVAEDAGMFDLDTGPPIIDEPRLDAWGFCLNFLIKDW
jgi:hypothetical protein